MSERREGMSEKDLRRKDVHLVLQGIRDEARELRDYGSWLDRWRARAIERAIRRGIFLLRFARARRRMQQEAAAESMSRPRHLFVQADLLSAPQYDLLIEIDGTGSLVFKPFRLRDRDDAPPGFLEGPWFEFVEVPGGPKP